MFPEKPARFRHDSVSNRFHFFGARTIYHRAPTVTTKELAAFGERCRAVSSVAALVPSLQTHSRMNESYARPCCVTKQMRFQPIIVVPSARTTITMMRWKMTLRSCQSFETTPRPWSVRWFSTVPCRLDSARPARNESCEPRAFETRDEHESAFPTSIESVRSNERDSRRPSSRGDRVKRRPRVKTRTNRGEPRKGKVRASSNRGGKVDGLDVLNFSGYLRRHRATRSLEPDAASEIPAPEPLRRFFVSFFPSPDS